MATWNETFLKRTSGVRQKYQRLLDGGERVTREAHIREDVKTEEEAESLIGHQSRRDVVRSSPPLNVLFHLTSTFVLVCSVVFYLFMYFRAPSDSACERRNWAWSKSVPPNNKV